MNSPLIVEYYSDVLCVWAWIAQRRIDELNHTFGDKIEFKHHYVDIFGDVPTKMDTSWKSKGGYEGFAKHVQHSAASFDDAIINEKIWTSIRPTTSANAHLYLKAIEKTYGEKMAQDMSLYIRQHFFRDGFDISNLQVLDALANQHELSLQDIHTNINDGSAMALLMSDYQQAKALSIKGSPSYVIDGGRQTLYGNVGYRVLHANIEEILKHPENEASWC